MRRLLLLDANIIIDLHTLGLFDRICKSYDVYVTPEVFKEADRYPAGGKYHKIFIKTKVKIIQDVALESIDEVLNEAREAWLSVDEGETTSIAAIYQRDMEDMVFCTCDKAAIKLVSFMNFDEQSISLEKALKDAGYHKHNLYHQHSEKMFRECIQEGKALRVLHKKFS